MDSSILDSRFIDSSILDSWERRQLLFVYGSLLLPTGIPEVDAAMAATRNLGRGHVQGRLYNLGDYPGLVPPAAGEADPPRVWGRLVALPNPDTILAALDAYEGYDPRDPQAGEFIRREAAVVMTDVRRTVTAQTYYCNSGIEGKALIESGDYLAFKRASERL